MDDQKILKSAYRSCNKPMTKKRDALKIRRQLMSRAVTLAEKIIMSFPDDEIEIAKSIDVNLTMTINK